MEELGAVIVAAGLSSRMGAFKPLLPIGKLTMITRVVDLMRRMGAWPIVVVTGYRKEELEAHLEGESVVFVHNFRYRETQMLDSLLLGLTAVRKYCERVLICPGDVPLVTEDTVQRLLAVNADFVRPTFEGLPGHPVLLRCDKISLLENYHGPEGLRGAIEDSGLELKEVVVNDIAITMDGDTPDDYGRLLSHYWQGFMDEEE